MERDTDPTRDGTLAQTVAADRSADGDRGRYEDRDQARSPGVAASSRERERERAQPRPAALIVGLSGTVLTAAEAAFLAAARPAGVILFRRNIQDAERLVALVAEARAASGAALVFIDQEGGRVQRLVPPLAPRYPAAAAIGATFAADPAAGQRAAWLSGRLIASDVLTFGINAPCLPVADVLALDAHDVIGDRAYGSAPEVVAVLARAVADGVLAAGAVPVVKHIPGHGRALADSHVALPRVAASRAALETDFAPFRALADLPVAMTAHVVYDAIDRDLPATLSPAVIAAIRADIGFGGLLLTDDISMGALGTGRAGHPSGAAAKDDRALLVGNACASLAAGCDIVLHCNGVLAEMEAIAAALPQLGDAAARRLDAAARRVDVAASGAAARAGIDALRAEFADLVALTA